MKGYDLLNTEPKYKSALRFALGKPRNESQIEFLSLAAKTKSLKTRLSIINF